MEAPTSRSHRIGLVLSALIAAAGCTPTTPDDSSAGSAIDLDHRTEVVFVPVSMAAPSGVAVRVIWPKNSAVARTGAPAVVLDIPGGMGPGALVNDVDHVRTLYPGLVHLQLTFPGGGTDLWASGGVDDARGAGSREALAAVHAFAEGTLDDVDGRSLLDLVGLDDLGPIVWYGTSNGGNLALATLARESSQPCGLALWETPISDSFVTVDFGGVARDTHPENDSDGNGIGWDDWLHPDYHSDACDTLGDCLFETGLLGFDGRDLFLDGNGDGVLGDGAGVLDLNGDGALDPTEDFLFGRIGGADGLGYWSRRVHREAAATVWAQGVPNGVASPEQNDAFWAERNGLAELHGLDDGALSTRILVLGTRRDHVQAAPDHPHVALAYQASRRVAPWTRLNPDLAYLRSSEGIRTPGPEHDANADLPIEVFRTELVPDGAKLFEHGVAHAAVFELADRCSLDVWDADLERPLIELEPCPTCRD